MSNDQKWVQLAERLAEIDDLEHAIALLGWDQQTYMPAGGAEARGEQMATIERVVHQRFTDPAVGQLLEDLAADAAALPESSHRASVWRVVRRRYDRATKLPEDLVAEMARTSARAFDTWVKARAANDFTMFEADLTHQVDLARQQTDHFGYEDTPYDALLAGYEPNLTSADVDRLFNPLRDRLVPLLDSLRPVLDRINDDALRGDLPHDAQIALTEDIVTLVGFDFKTGRQDLAAHPFTTSIGHGDTRVTTAVDPRNLAPALYASIHEAGHGTHDQGIPAELRRTAVGQVESLVIAESQSRLWENLVGRSRGFADHLLPYLRKHFPGKFGPLEAGTLYAAGSYVEPGYIRVQADEVTYSLHIFLRYEIERELIEGRLAVTDLPERWWSGMKSLLGVEPTTDADGVLQDVHWSSGAIGYFPTYALGTLLSVQLYEAALADDASIQPALEAADFAPLLAWMRQHVHRHGAAWSAAELVTRELGVELSADPFLDYLETKYRALYNL
ncbi:MAG: carboxypeptidase M32 [Chloroflexota bacterium]|jgi:carboxypeptidase Taq|nr:carboxypeptidase M32 [Chloroflexota bacterium]